jgi:serine/threonine-protein kinase
VRAARVEARERAKAREVTDFLESVLALASPAVSQRADLTVRDVLDDAARRIDAQLARAPEARAELHALVGSAWRELGELERAEAHLRASAAVLREMRPDTAELAGALSMLSEVLLAAHRGKEAEQALVEARALYASLPDQPAFYLGIVTNKLAEARRLQGELASAEELARRALGIYREAFGERHEAVAAALHNLASVQRDRGALADAEDSARAALSIQREAAGDDGLATARARLALAEVLAASGSRAEAEELVDEARRRLDSLLPSGHADRARAASLLGTLRRGP